jgi:hypothetical protein
MSDEFLEQIGEIAVGFAWLEDLLTEFLPVLCGTQKVAVFIKGQGFEKKCQMIEALMKLDPDRQNAEDVRKWVGECRTAAGLRNDALHSRYIPGVPGQWHRINDGKKKAMSVPDLMAINAQIADIYVRGGAYRAGWTDRQMTEDEARLDGMLEERPDEDWDD